MKNTKLSKKDGSIVNVPLMELGMNEMLVGVREEGGCEGVCKVVCRRLQQGKV